MKCLIRGGEAYFAFELVLHSHLYGSFSFCIYHQNKL